MAYGLRLEEIYDALFDDAAFARFPQYAAEAIGARSAIIGWIYEDGGQAFLGHCGYWSDDQIADYLRDFAHLDPWTIAAARNLTPNSVMDMANFVTSREWDGSALFNEFFRTMGDDTCQSICLPAQNDSGKGNIAFHLGRGHKGFDPSAVEALQQAGPHIGRLLGLRAKLSALENRAARSDGILDRMPHAAIVIGWNGKIIQANKAGETLLQAGDLVQSRGGMLSSRGPHATQIKASVAAACDAAAPCSTTTLAESETGQRMVVTALPFKVGTGARAALLLIQELLPADPGLAGRLQSLFGLTAAEADVTILISDGWSPSEIAEERKVSVGTVRSQLKSVMWKLGCRRQSEVAALVRSIVPIR